MAEVETQQIMVGRKLGGIELVANRVDSLIIGFSFQWPDNRNARLWQLLQVNPARSHRRRI